MTLRLLADVPEGAVGDIRIVSDTRARDLIRIGQAELAPPDAPDRSRVGERTTRNRSSRK